MNTLFFVINQNPGDGSAHGLYCLRHCWWLAAVEQRKTVRLIYPRPSLLAAHATTEEILRRIGLAPLPNFHLHALPALLKPRGGRGITVNAVYYWSLSAFLQKSKQPQDILAGASFPKLMRFLYGRKKAIAGLRRVYEVHQLLCLERGALSVEAGIEREVLAGSRKLLTTTSVLRRQLEGMVPGKDVVTVGLSCGFDPGEISERIPEPTRPFTLAYIGSLYPEQGVQWLVQAWNELSRHVGLPLELIIAGGKPAEVEELRLLAKERQVSVQVRGPVPPKDLSALLKSVDALIIPALPLGRMPYVALTKAYDYLGLNRPILASNLPSVAEVLRPGQEALLYAPGDVEALAAGISQVAKDQVLADTLVANCRERREAFSWESRSRQWWKAVTA
ncbi:Glycosyltransferase involved in cell wall bisynthesis [Desulfonatronum thiosulfatophilum]|uniref:Glycosyltransferase involved in cell wall bisynthesis n=1 Tax=Desulfonatronum thiosulfatophilum TaxID=617002 RepID=A0A1G6BD57_9BACT|nr:glycosyltransferase family 4 protein [Desulfonatronum thiosulfatophilum]SDB18582.1 Glycosyltransferase involved in cell wall bisynthesis [Desulfonatronum thiosulfatophilum]